MGDLIDQNDVIIDIDSNTDDYESGCNNSATETQESWIANDPQIRGQLCSSDQREDPDVLCTTTDTVIDIVDDDPWEDPDVCKLPPSAHEILDAWIEFHESNGIVQHSAEWLREKRFVVGGSKIAMVMGDCPYSAVSQYVLEKSSGINVQMGIAAQWGNMMEEIIKQQVERDFDCKVLGENLFVRDPTYKGVAYSPDGVAAMYVGARGSHPNRGGSVCNLIDDPLLDNAAEKAPRIVLVEFKCPWSRIPDGSPPANYVPQVKMGLDMIRIASIGLLAEGVYRRCTIPQLGTGEFNDEHTAKTKGAIKSPAECIRSGIIGLFVVSHPIQSHGLFDDWPTWYRQLREWRKTNGADFGALPADLFTVLMAAVDRRDLSTWYPQWPMSAEDATREFICCCRSSGCIPLGVLPWKLLRIDYHWIAPEYGFIEKVGPRISMINEAIIESVKNPRNSHNILVDFNENWEKLTGKAATSRGGAKKKAVRTPVVNALDVNTSIANASIANTPAVNTTTVNTITTDVNPASSPN